MLVRAMAFCCGCCRSNCSGGICYTPLVAAAETAALAVGVEAAVDTVGTSGADITVAALVVASMLF